MKCPEKSFTESELAEIIRNERKRRGDLPNPFAKQRTRVERLRCLYLFFEYNVLERRGFPSLHSIRLERSWSFIAANLIECTNVLRIHRAMRRPGRSPC
jgi:hypothetical protein